MATLHFLSLPVPMSWQISADVLANLVLAFNACFVGSLVLLRVVPSRPFGVETEWTSLEWISVSLSLGLGLLAWMMLPLWLVLPYHPILWRCMHAVLVAAGAAWWRWSRAAVAIRRAPRPQWSSLSFLEWVFWPLMGLALLYIGYLNLHTIGGSDGQTMHLKSILRWMAAGHYVPIVNSLDRLPPTVGVEQPQAGVLLLLQLSLLGDVMATGLFNVLLWMLAILGVFALGCRLGRERVGALGALFFLTSPVIFRYFLWDVTDYGLNLVVFLALCWCLVCALQRGDVRWLKAAAILAGLLYGIKAYAILQIATVAAIMLPLLYARGWLRAALAFAVPAVAVLAAPWWIHHWLLFGNPVWPYFRSVLGGAKFSEFWRIWTATRPYFLLEPYLQSGASGYGFALARFWWHQIVPASTYPFAFSFLLLPSALYFGIASFRRRLFLAPLGFMIAFLAVALNTPQLFNKYMVLVLAPTMPFLAIGLGEWLKRRGFVRQLVVAGLGTYVMVLAWNAIRTNDPHGGTPTVAETQPLAALNALPSQTLVFGNFTSFDIRYTRLCWKFRFIDDCTELMGPDWMSFFRHYQALGITHYLVEEDREVEENFPYSSLLPWIGAYDPSLARRIEDDRLRFDHNREQRDAYLAAHAEALPLGRGYVLYSLR